MKQHDATRTIVLLLLPSSAAASKEKKEARGLPLNGLERASLLTHPQQPPTPLPPSPAPLRPSPAPPPSRTTCLNFPPITSNGSALVINDGSGRRFFTAGMVKSESSGLLAFNSTNFERLLADSAAMGANTLRWNAFLKGLDFEWSPHVADEGTSPAGGAGAAGEETPAFVVSGLREGCLEAIRTGLDLAQRHGLVVQIALSTAHFLRFGYGGEGTELHGITNRDRVANCKGLLATTAGTRAYLSNVASGASHRAQLASWLPPGLAALQEPQSTACTCFTADRAVLSSCMRQVVDPMLRLLEGHPALLGFLIVNEGYSMVAKEDSVLTRTSDVTIPLVALQSFVNRVAGHVRRAMPGALLSSSLKLRINSRWNERTGVRGIGVWYEHEALQLQVISLSFTQLATSPPHSQLSARLLHRYEDEALIQAGSDPDGTLDLVSRCLSFDLPLDCHLEASDPLVAIVR